MRQPRHTHSVLPGLSACALACAFAGAQACSGIAIAADHASGFSGTYATRVNVTENACGDVTVMDMPTVVTHDDSTARIHLLHAGTDYPGTVAADSGFVTEPVTLTFDNGQRYRMTIAGKFNALGFDAVVTLDRTTVASGATCRCKVRWTGTRVSSGT